MHSIWLLRWTKRLPLLDLSGTRRLSKAGFADFSRGESEKPTVGIIVNCPISSIADALGNADYRGGTTV